MLSLHLRVGLHGLLLYLYGLLGLRRWLLLLWVVGVHDVGLGLGLDIRGLGQYFGRYLLLELTLILLGCWWWFDLLGRLLLLDLLGWLLLRWRLLEAYLLGRLDWGLLLVGWGRSAHLG